MKFANNTKPTQKCPSLALCLVLEGWSAELLQVAEVEIYVEIPPALVLYCVYLGMPDRSTSGSVHRK